MRIPDTQQLPASPIDTPPAAGNVSTNAPLETRRTSGDASLADLPSRATRGGGAFFGSPVQRPLADIRRVAAGQMKRIADMKAVALEREAMLAGNDLGACLPPGLKARVRDVAEQLAVRCAVAPEAGRPQRPVDGAWTYLQAIEAICSMLGAEHIAKVGDELRTALARTGHSQMDQDLLLNLIAEMTVPGRQTLARFMGERAFAGLCLPNLKMTEEGEKEPNSRTFNSILPNLAESTFGHDPMGRTLLWEGVCQLFVDGPRYPQRREKLRRVVFEFPNITTEGQSRLETPWEFIMAVDELQVDEAFDPPMLQHRS
ncbi:hypothetical protein OVY01_19325 [Robbsia sp. Bb-Pol-6]|uniref:Uncharacterized protein n=1 Tax=Robbsia betulipollinis TaxID=2981849 RepID=A0ABT3ZSA1_9BURK|nr:hypothetical protein [Robbsia betulipollinis]MCY0389302.1 hypothetical protein [Robbsia betulipollinis]